jgi:hypothetical protein
MQKIILISINFKLSIILNYKKRLKKNNILNSTFI